MNDATERGLRQRIDTLETDNERLTQQVKDLRSELARRRNAIEIVVPLSWGLTKSESIIASVLLLNDRVTYEDLLSALYDDRPAHRLPNDTRGTLSVLAVHTRKKLLAAGIRVRTIYGFGYAVENRSAVLAEIRAGEKVAA